MGKLKLNSFKQKNVFIWLVTSILFVGISIGYTALSPNIEFHPNPYFRGDAALYFDIIKNGHTLFIDPYGDWSGNSGWAPLFPWIIKGIQKCWHSEPKYIAFFLIHIFGSLALYRIISMMPNQKSKWFASILFLFAPGNIYFHALFPLTLLVWLLVEMIYCIQHSKWLLAGSFAYLAVLSYSIGFLLVLSILLWLLFTWKSFQIQKLWIITLPILGLITWFGYDWACNGHWDALFKIQMKYGHSVNTPWKMMGIRWKLTEWNFHSAGAWTELQNIFVLLLSCFGGSLVWKHRPQIESWQWYILFHIIVFTFIPYSSSPQSAFYRNALPISPAFVLLFPQIKTKLNPIILGLFILFSISTGYWFMADQLI